MRRYVVLSVLGACLLAFAPWQSALAGSTTYYAGTNAQGLKLLFSVDNTASGPVFDPIFINTRVRCPASGDVITVSDSFFGFQIPITKGKFNFPLINLTDHFNWSGTITSKGASGMEGHDFAAFDQQGGLQDCGAGSVSWAAKRLVPASSAPVAPRADYVVTITRARDGSVHYSITH